MKNIFIFFIVIINITFISCNKNNTGTTNPMIDSDLYIHAGNYLSQKEGNNYSIVTINEDNSLKIEYDNGDGLGKRTLYISPSNISENNENIYDFHYISPDTFQNRLITISINENQGFMFVNAWSTFTKGFLCKEEYLNRDSGISKYIGKYINGADSIEVNAAGGCIYNFQNEIYEVKPGFIIGNDTDGYTNFGGYYNMKFQSSELKLTSPNGLKKTFTKQ